MNSKEIIQQRSEGILIELVATGGENLILPLFEKHPELLATNLTNQLVRAAYEAELKGGVPKNYTKNLAESIHKIRVEAAKPKEAPAGEHMQKARPVQEVQ